MGIKKLIALSFLVLYFGSYSILSINGRYVPAIFGIIGIRGHEVEWSFKYMTTGNDVSSLKVNWALLFLYFPPHLVDCWLFRGHGKMDESELVRQPNWHN